MKKTLSKKRNPYLSKQSTRLLLELKAKPKHVILVCKRCGMTFRDYVDPRLTDNLCKDCSPLYQRVKGEKDNREKHYAGIDWWTDFVTYYLAGNFTKVWIDPDERRKAKNGNQA